MKTSASLLRITIVAFPLGEPLLAEDWPAWRGPRGDSTSAETELASEWGLQGLNLRWRVDFTGRSTPIVLRGKVCAQGREGAGIDRQEIVACLDADTGNLLWKRRFNVYQTTVPWNRVGWASPTADPETGLLYVQGVGGLFLCLDSHDGSLVWEKNLIEKFGFMEGYGGRTQTPVVDEGRVIVTFSNAGWGEPGEYVAWSRNPPRPVVESRFR